VAGMLTISLSWGAPSPVTKSSRESCGVTGLSALLSYTGKVKISRIEMKYISAFLRKHGNILEEFHLISEMSEDLGFICKDIRITDRCPPDATVFL
jgi:hypothetical protein